MENRPSIGRSQVYNPDISQYSLSTSIDERRMQCATVATAAAAAATTGASAQAGGGVRPRRRLPSPSDVEPDVQDVAVLDDVGLALEALLAGARGFRMRARL